MPLLHSTLGSGNPPFRRNELYKNGTKTTKTRQNKKTAQKRSSYHFSHQNSVKISQFFPGFFANCRFPALPLFFWQDFLVFWRHSEFSRIFLDFAEFSHFYLDFEVFVAQSAILLKYWNVFFAFLFGRIVARTHVARDFPEVSSYVLVLALCYRFLWAVGGLTVLMLPKVIELSWSLASPSRLRATESQHCTPLCGC